MTSFESRMADTDHIVTMPTPPLNVISLGNVWFLGYVSSRAYIGAHRDQPDLCTVSIRVCSTGAVHLLRGVSPAIETFRKLFE